MRRFDPPAIFAALDAERRRRGLTWAQVAAQTGVTALLAVAPPLIPLGIVVVNVALLGVFFLVGSASARSLMREVERATMLPA